jgi:hypothetical protein
VAQTLTNTGPRLGVYRIDFSAGAITANPKQTLAKKNRRELKGLVEGDSNGETVKAEMKQVAKIISARRF